MFAELEAIVSSTTQAKEFRISEIDNFRLIRGYLKAPKYICKYMDKFGMVHDKGPLQVGMGLFFLWVKVVDDAIDKSGMDGRALLDRFSNKSQPNNENNASLPFILTDALRETTLRQHDEIYVRLKEMYNSVLAERASKNIYELIEKRNESAHATALAALALMKPHVPTKNKKFESFFLDLAELGNIADSLIDFKKDWKNCEFEFNPTFCDYAILLKKSLFLTGAMLRSYPFLLGDYLLSPPYKALKYFLEKPTSF